MFSNSMGFIKFSCDVLFLEFKFGFDCEFHHFLQIWDRFSPFFTKTEAAAGSTGLYIYNDLTFKPREDISKKLYSAKELEKTFCELIMKNQTNVIVGCIYKHPHMDIDNFSKNYISPFLQQISKENKQLVLLGDFNINFLNFNDVDSVKNFVDTLESSFLLPSILLPTRVTATSSTLLLIISSFLLQNIKSLPEIFLLLYLTNYPNILYLNRIHMLAHQNQFNTEIGKVW